MAVAWCRRHWVAAEVMTEAPRLASRQPALHRHVVDEATQWCTQHGPHDVRPKAIARARDSNPEGVRGVRCEGEREDSASVVCATLSKLPVDRHTHTHADTYLPQPAMAATRRGPKSRAGFQPACVSGAYREMSVATVKPIKNGAN